MKSHGAMLQLRIPSALSMTPLIRLLHAAHLQSEAGACSNEPDAPTRSEAATSVALSASRRGG
jgi:hypothetical protein